MTDKTVYQTDVDGVYVGQVAADESPLEPDVFLIPAGCIEVAPPSFGEGQRARWVGNQWVIETLQVIAPEPEPELAQEEPVRDQQRYADAIQQHMDNAAQTFGYDSVQTAVTYAEEPAWPKFQQEGRGFRAWRSLVWAYTYEQLAQVQGGMREQPTIADFIMELPALVIPDLASEPAEEEPAV